MKRIKSKFPGIKVLVVEDYFINQELILAILEHMQCEVDIAEDGEKALNLYEIGDYDLILMDILLPQKDGLEITQEIRKREGGKKHSIIIALTANSSPEDMDKCLNAGMDDYLCKPMEASKLEEKMLKFFSDKAIALN